MAKRDLAAEARRAYKREWNRNNPEKVRAAQNRYWAKKAAEAAEKAQHTATAPPQE